MKNTYNEVPVRICCLLMAAAVLAGISGCAGTQTQYTVMGATNEVSRVTEEPYEPAFSTEIAAEEEPESSTAAAADEAPKQ